MYPDDASIQFENISNFTHQKTKSNGNLETKEGLFKIILFEEKIIFKLVDFLKNLTL